VRITYSD